MMNTAKEAALDMGAALEASAQNRIDPKYIDVLDGIRAVSVIIVVIFHFWQQTWIFPRIETPFLAFIGLNTIDFSSLAKVGYLFVDMMVLISGFLLFLPLMRQIFLNESLASWKQYAKKRVARILPSYLFSVILIFFCFAVPSGSYPDIGSALKDFITHITFTQTLFLKTYIGTSCNVVLWTVAVEVWFYILFPLFAELLRRREGGDEKTRRLVSLCSIAALYAVFNFIAYYYRTNVVFSPGKQPSMYINQLPAFMGVYANGMLGAMLFVLTAKHCERGTGFNAVNTLLSAASIVYIAMLINECASLDLQAAQLWQVTDRFRLSTAFMVFIISTALSSKWYRFIFSNKLMKFLAGISYNLYIWHQWLAVQLKYEWRFPVWSGSTPPNQLWDYDWMWKYAIVITVAAFTAAIAATYLIEKPIAKLILSNGVRKPKQ